MSDRTAWTLVAIVFLAFLADVVLLGGQTSFFLAKKFAALIDYLSFWR